MAAMELERYFRAFEEHVTHIEEETDARLQQFRQQCLKNFINRLTKQESEWEVFYRELLRKSQEDTPELRKLRNVSFVEKPEIKFIDNRLSLLEDSQPIDLAAKSASDTNPVKDSTVDSSTLNALSAPAGDTVDNAEKAKAPEKAPQLVEDKDDDPFPIELRDYFTNNLAVKDFIRIQEQQERNRQLLHELNNSPALRPIKNELNLFIRTQINSISNSSNEHLNTKTRLLVNLFNGDSVTFQDKLISASKHPQGRLLAMDLAAQIFVTVGTRLVNSVPAIAKSMAIVINGIVRSNLPAFKDLVVGHLQERCPYIIPMYPKLNDFQNQPDAEVKFKIACGYSYDMKTKQLESEDKYIARMRSMALIFASVLVLQDDKGPAWSWLASFLSLEPKPVITPTILQAFLQETSRILRLVYRSQFKKLLVFISTDYVKMIEAVTVKPQERQPLIKLKNQLSEIM